jgi:4-hydroxyphenylpyruvate dioxygenase
LILTTGLRSDSSVSEHVKKHGDGVKVLALWVDDAYKAFEETTKEVQTISGACYFNR